MNRLTIGSGSGAYVHDSFGLAYLDFTSGGIFEAPFGIQDKGIREVLSSDMPYAMYEAHYDNPCALRLKDMLRELTGMESVCLFSTGSEAAEAYWRANRVYTGKPNVWGGMADPDLVEAKTAGPGPLPDAMHGMTLGSMIMAGRMTWPGLDPVGVFQGRWAQSADSTSCAIWEPYHAPSAQFHREEPTINHLKLMIHTYPDLPHCSDEIQSGMGRTGKMFGYHWYEGLKPTFLLLGKMLGGGLPLSALCGPKEILEDDSVVENGHLHSTNSGNPMMAAVGCYVIERIQREFMVERSMELGMLLESCLSDIKQRHHCGKGLLAGIEFDGPLMASLVVNACRRRGLLVVDTGRKWVKLGPQLTITSDEILTGCDILKAAIEEVENEIEAQRDTGGEPKESGGNISQIGIRASEPSGSIESAKDD